MYNWRERLLRTIFTCALIAIAPLALAATAAQQSFVSPEAGVTALVEAVKANDQPMLREILGPLGKKLISSGDKVADQQSREAFIKAYSEANKVVLEGDQQAVLVIGQDEWPMPIPLVKSPAGWRFDTPQGEKEILTRRIGRNELAAIQVCLAIVDAAQIPKGLKVLKINVETYKSVVQLSGFADTSADMDKATDLARAVPGVRSVKNDMRIK